MPENGTLAKLVEIRNSYFGQVQTAIDNFNGQLQGLQGKYLDQLVDAALGDPSIANIQQLLKSKVFLGHHVDPESLKTEGAATIENPVPIAQSEDPSKFPLKSKRTRPATVAPICPACGTQAADAGARFCSKCAAPLFGVRIP
jgi:hypothetical protein